MMYLVYEENGMKGQNQKLETMQWYEQSIDEIFQSFRSSSEGLSAEEAGRRLDEFGRNELKERKRKTVLMMFADQFRDFMIMVLLAAAVVSGVIGEITDTAAIVVIVVLNAVIGFVQEYRAEEAMKALKEMAAPEATVLRDKEIRYVPSNELVPGDVVFLETGKIVPADMRLNEAVQLKIEEAALTGESVAVEKNTRALKGEKVSLGDRKNLAFKGTMVSYGRGTGVVVATGMDTELGKIATMLQEEEEVKTPLQKRLGVFGQRLGITVLAICAIVFVSGLLRGEEPLLMFLTAVSLAVAAIPEALPAVVTISLALGAKKMVRQNALIRKLPAVETLGSVTYICSDKTGTLTMNKMRVEELNVNEGVLKSESVQKKERVPDVIENNSAEQVMFIAMTLNNDVVTDVGDGIGGDATEVAFYVLANEKGFRKEKIEKTFPRIAEFPFDSQRKCMTTFHNTPGGEVVSFTKGAVEAVLEKSSRYLTQGRVENMTDETMKRITDASAEMAERGLRTLAFSMRIWNKLPDEFTSETAENGLTFVGFAGLMDPPREEAAESVNTCKTAGIKPVMITGDHPLTAKNIAKRIGIISDHDMVLTGQELSSLSMEEFEDRVEKVRVYARVAPEQKIKIVKALQDKGEFAAMTGDGVNDAPSLKRADIGIAMGITGTDVSKESSHMILLDDNFATIVKAVKEGRRIYDNIRKFIKYTMTSNSGEIWTIFLAPFLGLPIPLLPIHILWINLVTDGLPGLALAAEPAEKGVMERVPRHPKESIFAHGMAAHILWVGLLMGGLSIFTQAWAISTEHSHWQTMVFTVLCLSQMGHVLAIRSERESLFRIGPLSNMPLFGSVILTFILQMATIYVPLLNRVFKTEPLTPFELALALIISSGVFFVVEMEKWWLRRK